MPDLSADDSKRVRFILYAEDDPADILFFNRAVKVFRGQLNFAVVTDGQKAIDWLKGKGHYANREMFPLPDVLITDLKMPRVDGFEVLRFVRGHPKLKNMPVIIRSSSDLDEDLAKARAMGATDYIQKAALCDGVVEYLRRYVDTLSAADVKLSARARCSR